MILELGMLSDDSIKQVLGDPILIWRVVAPDDPDILKTVMSMSPEGWSRERNVELPPLPLSEIEKSRCYLDKAWHGIHYLLTKTQWEGDPPLNFLLGGGKVVGDVDVGYGPARVLDSSEAATVSAALEPITREYLTSRFDPDDMTEKQIYPDIWDRDPAEDGTLDYCLQFFDELKKFVADAAANRMGLVIRIC